MEDAQLKHGLMPARATFKGTLPTPPTAAAARTQYVPTVDASRVVVTLEGQLARQAELLQQCKTAGVPDVAVAYLIRTSNVQLLKRAACAAAGASGTGAPRRRRAALTVNEEAVPGGSCARAERGDDRVVGAKRKAAADAHKAAPLSKAPKQERERKKEHDKHTVVRTYHAKGNRAAPSAQALAAHARAAS